jgi:hypothetical protein
VFLTLILSAQKPRCRLNHLSHLRGIQNLRRWIPNASMLRSTWKRRPLLPLHRAPPPSSTSPKSLWRLERPSPKGLINPQRSRTTKEERHTKPLRNKEIHPNFKGAWKMPPLEGMRKKTKLHVSTSQFSRALKTLRASLHQECSRRQTKTN